MCLIFVGQGYPRKLFNLEHFPIYGISELSNECGDNVSSNEADYSNSQWRSLGWAWQDPGPP